jgi:hypothetical protein
VARHAQPRATKDLDILVQTTPKNAAAVYAALVEFGAPLRTRAEPDGELHAPTRQLTAKDFEDKGTWYTMGVPPVAIDILSEIQGITFSAAWKNRATLVVDDERGLKAHFISREDLIAAKLPPAGLATLPMWMSYTRPPALWRSGPSWSPQSRARRPERRGQAGRVRKAQSSAQLRLRSAPSR